MSQANSDKSTNLNIQDMQAELIHLQCEFYRRLNALLSQEAADNLGRRIGYIAKGAFLPAAGFADVSTMVGFLNLDERTMFDQLKKTEHEKLGFGRTVFYSIAEWFLAKRRPADDKRRK